MSSKQINILLTGATGYIGGSILTGLLQHPNASNFKITTLVRGDENRVKKLLSLGVIPLLGSNESYDIIDKAASESDVVIHTANSADDLPSTQSIISGLNKRTQLTRKPVIYIHTSGTGVLAEDVRGKKGSNTVYSDLDPEQINDLADEQIHRHVDLFIINAAQANPQLKSVIVLPPVIYGFGTGLFNKNSIAVPALIGTALKRGQAEVIGQGESIWESIHIADLVDAYIILFDRLLEAYGPDAKFDTKPSPFLTTGREGYYFAENGHQSWREISDKIGNVLQSRGLLKSSQVSTFPVDEVDNALIGPMSWILGSHSRSKAERLRKMGWNPRHHSILNSVEEQVEATIPDAKK